MLLYGSFGMALKLKVFINLQRKRCARHWHWINDVIPVFWSSGFLMQFCINCIENKAMTNILTALVCFHPVTTQDSPFHLVFEYATSSKWTLLPSALLTDLSKIKTKISSFWIQIIYVSYFATPSSIILLFYQFTRRFPSNFSRGKWCFHHYFLFSTKTTFQDFLAFFSRSFISLLLLRPRGRTKR